MKIEIGKRYITRNGQVTSPVEKNTGGIYNEVFPFTVKIRHGRYSYRNDGRYFKPNYDHYMDLVEEYVDEVEQEGIRLLSEELEELSKSNHVPEIEEEIVTTPDESGDESRVFDTGSRRDSDKGKPRIQDLLAYTRLRFGYHLTLGGERYGFSNFTLGQPDDSSLASIDRHLAALMQGDMSEDHASAIIFGVQLIMMNQEKNGIQPDHFYKKNTKNK